MIYAEQKNVCTLLSSIQNEHVRQAPGHWEAFAKVPHIQIEVNSESVIDTYLCTNNVCVVREVRAVYTQSLAVKHTSLEACKRSWFVSLAIAWRKHDDMSRKELQHNRFVHTVSAMMFPR